MKNIKGFTLVEVIGAVIILGILAILAVPLFTKQLNTFRDDYYENLVSNFENSGREFFSDNRMYRPTGKLEAAKVTLNTLNGQKYIDEFVDYEGGECNKNSYVVVIRKDKDEYDYHACLKCENDDYDNTVGNKFCDPAWFDPTTLGYTLGDIDPIYVYKGTDRKVLEEQTKIPVWIVKYDDAGNVLETIDGTGVENVPEIYPVDLDRVDTSKIGEYTTTYKFDTKDADGNPTTLEKTSSVIVYENNKPIITLTKTNNVKTGQSSSENKTTPYVDGEWAQKVTITFGRGEGVYNETGTSASKYQWKRGNKWIDICTPTAGDTCVVEITEEMNEVIYFRMVSTDGNISQVSDAYNFKIDTTPPKGEVIITEATMGNNDYYKSAEVKLGTQNITDVVGTDPDALSGVKYYTIVMSEIPTRSGSNGTITGTQKDDGNSITWYIFVEDNAENSGIYSITFKKDSTPPSASWDPESGGPHDNNNGITATGTCTDVTSGAIEYSEEFSISSPTSSSGKEVSINCEDNAGNTATLKKTYKVRYHSRDSSCDCETYNSCKACSRTVSCKVACTKYCCTMGGAGESCGHSSDKSNKGDGWHCSGYTSECDGTCTEYYYCRVSSCGCETYEACWHY